MREVIRSGRRANFYTSDNSFIDNFARELQPTDIAVYHALARFADAHTRSTWVGTAKVAEVLNLSQRTVQRSLKNLEDLKLIRIVQTSTVKMYFILPVPIPAKKTSTPLFDAIDEQEFSIDDTLDAFATQMSDLASEASHDATLQSHRTTATSPRATDVTRQSDKRVLAYKEEQDVLNKTKKQNSFNNEFEPENVNAELCANRLTRILGLSQEHLPAALAAVQVRARATKLSMDGLIQDLSTAANVARRRGIDEQNFLNEFLAQTTAEQIVNQLHLPATTNLVSIVSAAVKAEASYTGLPIDKVKDAISEAALDDRRRGITIDRFYFENCKWRSNAGTSKAEQRKLNNLEVNARVKQRLRQSLGVS